MIQNEIWREVRGFKGNYRVSNLGNVISKAKSRRLSFNFEPYIRQYENKKGDRFVKLGNLRNMYKVSELVARAFVDNPHCYPFVAHKDGDLANNRADNLEWALSETPARPKQETASTTDEMVKVLGLITRTRRFILDAAKSDSTLTAKIRIDHLNTLAAEVAEYIGGRVML